MLIVVLIIYTTLYLVETRKKQVTDVISEPLDPQVDADAKVVSAVADLSAIANTLDDALFMNEIVASLAKSQKDAIANNVSDNMYSSLFTVISSQYAWPADSAFNRGDPKAFHGPYMIDAISSDWNPMNDDEAEGQII